MFGKAIVPALILAGGVWADRQPNIVVIFTDDIGYGDISCLNPQSGFQTLVVDALAKEGIVFHQAHSTAAF